MRSRGRGEAIFALPSNCATRLLTTSDKKSIVHTLSLKYVFVGYNIRKGARSFGGIAEERNKIWQIIYFSGGIAKTRIEPLNFSAAYSHFVILIMSRLYSS